MKRVVLVICDGLRADMLCSNWTPNLQKLRIKGRFFEKHRGVFPSTTRTTAASIATGCYPARHGLEGNCVAIDEGQGLQAVSVGPADFRERLRKATGKTLRVPTISERLYNKGGAIIYSNVSPGAAYFNDPDGFGYVYHRSGSFGPNLEKIKGLAHLDISHDNLGDSEMTHRFCDEVLNQKKPAYSVLWQCEPDHTQHAEPLGSPAHLAAISAADNNVKKVYDVINAQVKRGEQILLIVASDHGHETVSRLLPLSDLLIEAGLKVSRNSVEIVVASNGLSANIYMSDQGREKLEKVVSFLHTVDGLDKIFWGERLDKIGHRKDGSLAISVTTKRSDAMNQYGIKGESIAIVDPLHEDTNIGSGQHGGLGKYEQNPFLMFVGYGVAQGSVFSGESSAVDLAPTVLRFLGEPYGDMDGNPLPLED